MRTYWQLEVDNDELMPMSRRCSLCRRRQTSCNGESDAQVRGTLADCFVADHLIDARDEERERQPQTNMRYCG